MLPRYGHTCAPQKNEVKREETRFVPAVFLLVKMFQTKRLSPLPQKERCEQNGSKVVSLEMLLTPVSRLVVEKGGAAVDVHGRVSA